MWLVCDTFYWAATCDIKDTCRQPLLPCNIQTYSYCSVILIRLLQICVSRIPSGSNMVEARPHSRETGAGGYDAQTERHWDTWILCRQVALSGFILNTSIIASMFRLHMSLIYRIKNFAPSCSNVCDLAELYILCVVCHQCLQTGYNCVNNWWSSTCISMNS